MSNSNSLVLPCEGERSRDYNLIGVLLFSECACVDFLCIACQLSRYVSNYLLVPQVSGYVNNYISFKCESSEEGLTCTRNLRYGISLLWNFVNPK